MKEEQTQGDAKEGTTSHQCHFNCGDSPEEKMTCGCYSDYLQFKDWKDKELQSLRDQLAAKEKEIEELKDWNVKIYDTADRDIEAKDKELQQRDQTIKEQEEKIGGMLNMLALCDDAQILQGWKDAVMLREETIKELKEALRAFIETPYIRSIYPKACGIAQKLITEDDGTQRD